MGQSILRTRRKPRRSGVRAVLVARPARRTVRKGIRLKFRNRDTEMYTRGCGYRGLSGDGGGASSFVARLSGLQVRGTGARGNALDLGEQPSAVPERVFFSS